MFACPKALLLVMSASLVRIEFRLPARVLISPLCAMRRNGCARFQLGKLFVENRECTCRKAMHVSYRQHSLSS